MAYEMASYPASKREASKVRDAQIEFVARHLEPALPEGKWRHADHQAWASTATSFWYADQGTNLFALVESAVHRMD